MRNKVFTIKIVLIPSLIAAGFLFPLITQNPYHLHVLINIFIWCILALGIRIILVAGHLNAAQASFMGIGAYGSALLVMKLGWSFWLAMPAAGLIAAFISALVGYSTFRIKGAYFVMVTFAITEVCRQVWMMWKGLFGGAEGLLGIPRPAPIDLAGITISFTSKVPFYYLALSLFLIAVLIYHRLHISRFGLTLRSFPQAELLAECSGINVIRHKVIAFVVSSFFAGIAGSFAAHYFTYASPWDFVWTNSLYMLLYAVIGGVSTVAGPILGCFVMLGLDELLRPFKQYMPIFLGAVLIFVLLFLPDGLCSIPERMRTLLKRRSV